MEPHVSVSVNSPVGSQCPLVDLRLLKIPSKFCGYPKDALKFLNPRTRQPEDIKGGNRMPDCFRNKEEPESWDCMQLSDNGVRIVKILKTTLVISVKEEVFYCCTGFEVDFDGDAHQFVTFVVLGCDFEFVRPL